MMWYSYWKWLRTKRWKISLKKTNCCWWNCHIITVKIWKVPTRSITLYWTLISPPGNRSIHLIACMILIFSEDSADKNDWSWWYANLMTTSKIRSSYYSPHSFSMKFENTSNRDVVSDFSIFHTNIRSLKKYRTFSMSRTQ